VTALLSSDWQSTKAKEPLEIALDNYVNQDVMNGEGFNTLAIYFSAAVNSDRFCFNLTGENNDKFREILFHFNPRQNLTKSRREGCVVVNDMQEGVWGRGASPPLNFYPPMFGVSTMMLIQLGPEGFDFLLQDATAGPSADPEFCFRFPHRTLLPPSGKLILQFTTISDDGVDQDWTIHRILWGSRSLVQNVEREKILGGNRRLHPRKLFITGLPRVDAQNIENVKGRMERAFYKYGGQHGAKVVIQKGWTYAFVLLGNETLTKSAMADPELARTYRMQRAIPLKEELEELDDLVWD